MMIQQTFKPTVNASEMIYFYLTDPQTSLNSSSIAEEDMVSFSLCNESLEELSTDFSRSQNSSSDCRLQIPLQFLASNEEEFQKLNDRELLHLLCANRYRIRIQSN